MTQNLLDWGLPPPKPPGVKKSSQAAKIFGDSHIESVRLDEAREGFLTSYLGRDFAVSKLAGDASFRTYYRVSTQAGSVVLMDAPPGREDSSPFLDIARFLRRHGVRTPEILAESLSEGFFLLEDFGDTTYLLALAETRAEPLYQEAVESLLAIQATPVDGSCMAHGRPYDRKLLRFELSLFTDWYIEGIRKQPISPEDGQRFDRVFHTMIDRLLEQPVVLVHRDYHSRNLMWQEGKVGIIDFQDAVMGPITYDLASLLRDCYVRWEEPFRRQVMESWFSGAGARLGYASGWEAFQRDFDLMSIQRNLKAIGIFGRLSLRDGKHGYLRDIPRTMGYVLENLARHPEWGELAGLIGKYAAPEEGV